MARKFKLQHLVGKRVELIEMKEDPCPVEVGTKGTVIMVNEDMGVIDVKWDNGRTLNLIAGFDKYKTL